MKSEIAFVCDHCGKQLVKWMGRCPGCGEWNSEIEERGNCFCGLCSTCFTGQEDTWNGNFSIQISGESRAGLGTGIEELDRVLGGGIVRRSVILVGGDPGIGKSTLLMQALGHMAHAGQKVLYVSGEESSEQLKLRSERVGIRSDNFLVLVENELETIIDRINQSDAAVVVLDSVQSVFSRSFEAQAGSVSQIRQVAGRIIECTKRGSSASFIVGHVTKDGALAGPKVLEHMVDTVLYFEGERGHSYRILRAVKTGLDRQAKSVSSRWEIPGLARSPILRSSSCPSGLKECQVP